MAAYNPNIVHAETPFIVNWNAATGDRLTRYRSIIEQFATRDAALAALAAPFGAYVVDGMVRDFSAYIAANYSGTVQVIATRKRGKKLVIKA